MITLSGANKTLLQFDEFVHELHQNGFQPAQVCADAHYSGEISSVASTKSPSVFKSGVNTFDEVNKNVAYSSNGIPNTMSDYHQSYRLGITAENNHECGGNDNNKRKGRALLLLSISQILPIFISSTPLCNTYFGMDAKHGADCSAP